MWESYPFEPSAKIEVKYIYEKNPYCGITATEY
jgi:hypothetical protein